VTAYNNGKYHKSGAGYGFRINNSDVRRYFQIPYSNISLHLENSKKEILVNLNSSSISYGERIIITNKEIGKWLIKNKMAIWSEGTPPKFKMIHLNENKFVIRKID